MVLPGKQSAVFYEISDKGSSEVSKAIIEEPEQFVEYNSKAV
ncbi:hypothetical protein PRBEI_2000429400 [Prionailurus iriomotensis]